AVGPLDPDDVGPLPLAEAEVDGRGGHRPLDDVGAGADLDLAADAEGVDAVIPTEPVERQRAEADHLPVVVLFACSAVADWAAVGVEGEQVGPAAARLRGGEHAGAPGAG